MNDAIAIDDDDGEHRRLTDSVADTVSTSYPATRYNA